jgi:hypothetical protein
MTRLDERVWQEADGWHYAFRVREVETFMIFPRAHTPCDFDAHGFCEIACDCECHL